MLFLALAGLVSSCDFTNRRPSNFGNTRLEVKRPRWNHKGRTGWLLQKKKGPKTKAKIDKKLKKRLEAVGYF